MRTQEDRALARDRGPVTRRRSRRSRANPASWGRHPPKVSRRRRPWPGRGGVSGRSPAHRPGHAKPAPVHGPRRVEGGIAFCGAEAGPRTGGRPVCRRPWGRLGVLPEIPGSRKSVTSRLKGPRVSSINASSPEGTSITVYPRPLNSRLERSIRLTSCWSSTIKILGASISQILA